MISESLVMRYVAGGALLVAAVFGMKSCRSDSGRARAELRADSVEASADSTRTLAVAKARAAITRLYGDSMLAVERRVVQTPQLADAVDRALNRQRKTLTDLEARIVALQATVTAPVTRDSTDSLRATFTGRMVPYTYTATVAMPAAGSGRLALDVALDSARLSLRLQCAPVRGVQVRQATALVAAPTWLAVTLSGVQAAPDVCNPAPVAARRFSLGVSVGYGLTLSGGQAYVGPSTSVGLTYRVF